MSRPSNMPRSSSSRYGLLDWMSTNEATVLKCPSRDNSLEFSERGVRSEQSSIDTMTRTSRGRTSFQWPSFVTRADNDSTDGSDQSINRDRYNVVKNKLLAILVFLTIICATLTGVAITGKRIDLSSMARVLKLTAGGGNTGSEVAVTVDTNCGKIIGSVIEGAFVFKGIPYALPPQGQLRWSRPVPLFDENNSKCSKSTKYQATEFGPKCFQVNPWTKNFDGSEDCLYLNVWTPTTDENAKLPVMVYFHGGFLQFGSGHDDGLLPTSDLAKEMDTVFVSFNYRLLSLGFLSLDILAADQTNGSAHGNYGLWDQVAVLNWIHDNIKSFGGDPNKVTLFGPDAGAACIMALSTNPNVGHLFQSSWLIGPAIYFNVSFSESAKRNNNGFLKRSGCQDIQCLRSIEPLNVVKLFLGSDDPSFRINDQNDLPIQGIFPEQLIVVNGELVMDMPSKPASIKPILLGSSSQAIDYWPGPSDLKQWSWTEYTKYVTTSLDSFNPKLSQAILELYPPPQSTGTSNGTGNLFKDFAADESRPESLYARMVTDVRLTCPLNKMLEDIAATAIGYSNHGTVDNVPLYRYIITNRPTKMVYYYSNWINAAMAECISSECIKCITFFDTLETLEWYTLEVEYYILSAVAIRTVVGMWISEWFEVKLFEYESSLSFHMFDLVAFFDTFDTFSGSNHRSVEGSGSFRDTVRGMVAKFTKGQHQQGKSGNGSMAMESGLWKQFPIEMALVGNNITLVHSSMYQKWCNFWSNQGLLDYAWVS